VRHRRRQGPGRRLLTRHRPPVSSDDQPNLAPALADAVRRAYVRPVDEGTAGRHMSAIVAAASAGGEPVARRSRHRRRVWRPILAAAAATLLLPVGLAVAGVSLPNALQQPYRAVGISLPHQTGHAAPAPVPAMRPVTPHTPAVPPATATPARPAKQRARHPHAGHRHRQRARRHANPIDRPDRQHNPRGPTVRPPPRRTGPAKKHGQGPPRPTRPQHKPASPKPNAGPKQPRSRRDSAHQQPPGGPAK
jgi:hypothetical protein